MATAALAQEREQEQETFPEMSLEEFLAWDGGGHVGKLELVQGRVRAMAPASATHAIIQANIVTAINVHLRAGNSPCRAGTEAPIVPPMARRRNARAPDVAVTCSPIADNGTFENPVLIAEVMSPSNEKETWDSVLALAGLLSLQEILIVQSTEARAEVFRRDPTGAWPSAPESVAMGGSVRLASIGLLLSVADIYFGTELT